MNNYIEISIDANEFFNVVTGKMQWRSLWKAFMLKCYIEHSELGNWSDIYNKTHALRKSVFNDLKKYYRKNKKLYIITISVKV